MSYFLVLFEIGTGLVEVRRWVTRMVSLERCTRQFAPTAAQSVKYLSSQQKIDLFIAESVIKNTDHKEDTNFVAL